MNRQQKRMAAKQQTPQNIEKMARAEADRQFNLRLEDLVKKATRKTMVIAIYALRNEFGFGQKRLEDFITRFNLDAMCVEDGENGLNGQPKLSDIEKLIEDEVKIKFS